MNDSNLSIRSELKYQMTQITQLFDDLRDTVQSSEFITAEVFKLPVVNRGAEHLKIEEIPVEHLHGERAFFEGVQSFRKMYADEGVSTKAAYRLPGYIQLGSSKGSIKKIISQINSHKELFKLEVQKIEGAKKKHDLIHELFPGLITKQLYRKLHTVDDNISSMGFFWANRFVTYKTTKDEVIASIKKQMNHPPKGRDSDEWISFLNMEITDIQRLPKGSELRYKRPAKVSAAVNIDSEVTPQLSAHLPIIVLQREPVTISPLISYNAAYRRCVRSDSKIGGKPVIQRLHLYVKKM